MSKGIHLIYTTVRRVHGDCCDLCKNREKWVCTEAVVLCSALATDSAGVEHVS